jgi:hypothetical protein
VRWTQAAGAIAALALLPGCALWIGTRYPVSAGYAHQGRPAPSYYCYDCHGYRYLDPYYDWCMAYGFRYDWNQHPEAVRVYRERYVRIKESNPSFGRYRYPADYRAQRRYREPRDYDSWRTGTQKPPVPGGLKVREKVRQKPGNNEMDRKKRRDRERQPAEPWDARPDGRRPGTPGGA